MNDSPINDWIQIKYVPTVRFTNFIPGSKAKIKALFCSKANENLQKGVNFMVKGSLGPHSFAFIPFDFIYIFALQVLLSFG